MLRHWIAVGLLALITTSPADAGATPEKLLATIQAVGSQGKGNWEAAQAWKELVSLGTPAFFPTLDAMDHANAIALNWLRVAAEAIFENSQKEKKPISAEQLEKFVEDTQHAPLSRRMAYEFLVRIDPKAPERVLPGKLDDPSVDMRRDAIAAALEKTESLLKSDPAQAAKQYQKLFTSSRDMDQAEAIAKKLKELKVATDLTAHFGVLTQWHIIGPFDSTEGAGFAKAFEPEKKVDLNETVVGKDGSKLTWKKYTSTETYGDVDFNKGIKKFKDSVAYGFTVVESERETPVQIRFASNAAVKVFVNGQEVFAREEYHHGFRFDQYRASATLKKGKNEILVKECQNNQTEPWAQDWKFQLRICDSTGGAVPLKMLDAK